MRKGIEHTGLLLLALTLVACAGMAPPPAGGTYGPSQSVGPGGVQQSAGPWGPSQSVGPGGVRQSGGPYGPSQSVGPGGVQQSAGGPPRGGSGQVQKPGSSCRATCPDESASVECPGGKVAACQCEAKPYAACRPAPPPKK